MITEEEARNMYPPRFPDPNVCQECEKPFTKVRGYKVVWSRVQHMGAGNPPIKGLYCAECASHKTRVDVRGLDNE